MSNYNFIEACTWRVIAELLRRSDGDADLRVVALHPGGGHYDCISLVAGDGSTSILDLNRNSGRAHFWIPRDRPPSPTEYVAALDAGDDAIVDRIAHNLGLDASARPVTEAPAALHFAVIADIAKQLTSLDHDFRVECGWHDSSGMEGYYVEEWVKEVPGLAAALEGARSPAEVASRVWRIGPRSGPDGRGLFFEVVAGRAHALPGGESGDLRQEVAQGASLSDVAARWVALLKEPSSKAAPSATEGRTAARTSVSHPLRIDTLEVGGVLGLTFCPGKRQRGALTGDWGRDLATDLEALRTWGAEAVVSAMEPHELEELGVAGLGAQVEAHGMDWHPIEIRDADVPDRRAEARWFYVQAQLRRILARGGRAVIHCKGGLGRTGTLAAILLADELGIEADDAIARVRQARAGAIETSAQEAYVRRRKAPWPAAARERILGCLVGGAVGDAFGYAVEFSSLSAIRAAYGPDGLTEPVFHDGQLRVTDDTQMTLFTAEALCLAPPDADGDRLREAAHAAYLRWLATQQRSAAADATAGWLLGEPSLHASRAPGATCMSALASGICGTIERPINDSKGCGGVMRVAPVGLCRLSAAEAFDVGAQLAAVTHGHPSGIWSSGAMARLVRDLTDDASLTDAVEAALAQLRTCPGSEETVARLEQARRLGQSSTDIDSAIRALGQGWVGEEALAIAVFAMFRGTSFRQVLRIATNHDGDSDSTASIAGQLWGTAYGLEGIPNAWSRRLDVLDALLRTAEELCRARS